MKKTLSIFRSTQFLIYEVGIHTSKAGQLKKKTELCGYLGNRQNVVGEMGICSIAKGNLDAEEVVA